MHSTASAVVHDRLLYGIEVKTVMQQEALVLARHDGYRQMLGDFVHADPMVVHGNGLPVLYLLHRPYDHKRSDIYRHVLEQQHRKDC